MKPLSRISCSALLIAAVHTQLADAATVSRWAPENISSAQFESHPAFDPRTGDLYFVRSAPDFSGWRIYVAPFARDTRGPKSGELYLWRAGKPENWPPACAKPR